MKESTMTTILLRRLATRRAVASMFAAALLCSCALSPGVDAPLKSAKARIEGVYSLQEWHLGGEIARPPRVDGRFLLRDGEVITLLHNRVQEANQITIASYGSYSLDATHFSYRYDDWSVFVQAATATTVSRKPPWDGMRALTVTSESNAVRLRSGDGLQEFLFTPDGLTYSENGRSSVCGGGSSRSSRGRVARLPAS
jgi:hypothetical protein